MKEYLNNIIVRCPNLEKLKGKKIFIAGYGFYGQWIANTLKLYGLNVECGARSLNGWDINKPKTYTYFQKSADFVINACGRSDVTGDISILSYGPEMLYKETQGTILHISSGVVARGDTSLFSKAKIYAEDSVKQLPNLKIVRPFATVGPGMGLNKPFSISTFINERLQGQTLEVFSGVKSSFCHITDLITQMIHVLIDGKFESYEVGSDDLIDIEDAARAVSSYVKTSTRDFTKNPVKEYSANLSRIRNEFNLSLDYDSISAIRDTVKWYVSKV